MNLLRPKLICVLLVSILSGCEGTKSPVTGAPASTRAEASPQPDSGKPEETQLQIENEKKRPIGVEVDDYFARFAATDNLMEVTHKKPLNLKFVPAPVSSSPSVVQYFEKSSAFLLTFRKNKAGKVVSLTLSMPFGHPDSLKNVDAESAKLGRFELAARWILDATDDGIDIDEFGKWFGEGWKYRNSVAQLNRNGFQVTLKNTELLENSGTDLAITIEKDPNSPQ